MHLNCQRCQGPLPKGRSPKMKYCSNYCRFQGTQLHDNCQHCDEPLPEDRSPKMKYCNRLCISRAQYVRDQEKIRSRQRANYVPKGERTATCDECGDEFTAIRSDARFCSQSCSSGNWYRNNPEKVKAQKVKEKAERHAARDAHRAARLERVCDEDGCERNDIRPPRSGNKCDMHYQRAQRAARRVAKLGVRICPQCGGDMSTARINAVRCSEECTRKANRERNADAIRERGRIHQATRRALNDGRVVVPFTLEEWDDLKISLGDECTYCGVTAAELATRPVNKKGRGNRLEMDHIVPMARNGAHALANLTPACPACNQSKKQHRLLLDWAPKLLGGFQRYDRTRPHGTKYIEHDPTLYRNATGPLPHIVELAQRHPSLLRAIRITEPAHALAV